MSCESRESKGREGGREEERERETHIHVSPSVAMQKSVPGCAQEDEPKPVVGEAPTCWCREVLFFHPEWIVPQVPWNIN